MPKSARPDWIKSTNEVHPDGVNKRAGPCLYLESRTAIWARSAVRSATSMQLLPVPSL